VVALLYSHCDVDCLKVNVTVGDVNADVRERLQPYQAVQGEHQAPYRFMLFAQQELVMVILGESADDIRYLAKK